MNKLLIAGAAAGVMCVAGASEADGFYFQPHANLALYGSYMDQNNEQAGVDPGGGGGGAQLGLSITPNVFIGGSYQYNYLTESNAPVSAGVGSSYGERVNQGRVGGGLVFHTPVAPLDVYGKVEYVHYDYQVVHAESGGVPLGNADRISNDGVGLHAGVQTRFPGFSVYGSVGYLQLDNSEGPEINVGFETPMAPFTWAFFEYRYDDLHNKDSFYYDRTESDDVRAGVRMSF
jgi:hypothetical protein